MTLDVVGSGMLLFGEAYLASAGLERLTRLDSRPLMTSAIQSKIDKLPDAIRGHIRTLLSNDDDGTEFPPGPSVDIRQALESVSAPLDSQTLETRSEELSEPGQIAELILALQRVRDYLREIAPPSKRATPVGLVDAPMSAFARSRFGRAVKVAQEPLWVLEALAKGGLSRDMADHLRAMFPAIYEAAEEALQAEFQRLQTAGKHALTRRQTWAISAFLGIASPDPMAVQAVLSAREEQAPDAASPSGSFSSESSKLAERTSTEVQEVSQ